MLGLITSKGIRLSIHLAITDNFILTLTGKRGRGISIVSTEDKEIYTSHHLTLVTNQSLISTLIWSKSS